MFLGAMQRVSLGPWSKASVVVLAKLREEKWGRTGFESVYIRFQIYL